MRTIFIAILLLATATIYAQPKIGEQAPDISMTDTKGKLQQLSALKGKVVLIDFWASWCGPCRRAMPELVSLYHQYRSKGFEIYGISLDEKTADWKKAVATDKITWIQVNEPGGWNGPTATAWKIEQLPSSFLLDRTGKIIRIDPSGKDLRTLLEQLLTKS